MNMKGKVALVTGAGSGIGRATAVMLAGAGAKVGVLTHTEREARETEEEIRAKGAEAVVLVADVADARQMQGAVEKLVGQFGRLDLVHANAGINGVWAPIDELQAGRVGPDDQHQPARHLSDPAFRRAAPQAGRRGRDRHHRLDQRHPHVSRSAGATAYTATKAAQVAMVQSWRWSSPSISIRVNAVCPGGSKPISATARNRATPRRPSGRRSTQKGYILLTGNEAGKGEDVARLVCFLLSDEARAISAAHRSGSTGRSRCWRSR